MAHRSFDEIPPEALPSVALAETLAREHVRRGGDAAALLAAFAGLVTARDKAVGADCLVALDRHVSAMG
jgi:hypothetical protein